MSANEKPALDLIAPIVAGWQFKPTCLGDDETNVLPEIEAFLRETGMTAAAFGRRAMHDTQFVNNLRWGQRCRVGTADRARFFMKEYRA